MRRATHLLTALIAVAFIPPVAVVCHATIAVPCCFGVVCPQVNGCDTHTSPASDITCKRTCSPTCTDGSGCCQFRTQTRYYENCTPKPADCPEVVSVYWNAAKHCRPSQAGDEVACLETAVNECKD